MCVLRAPTRRWHSRPLVRGVWRNEVVVPLTQSASISGGPGCTVDLVVGSVGVRSVTLPLFLLPLPRRGRWTEDSSKVLGRWGKVRRVSGLDSPSNLHRKEVHVGVELISIPRVPADRFPPTTGRDTNPWLSGIPTRPSTGPARGSRTPGRTESASVGTPTASTRGRGASTEGATTTSG